MNTTVRCEAATDGRCKELNCLHFFEHSPTLIDGSVPCTTDAKCGSNGFETCCKLSIEN